MRTRLKIYYKKEDGWHKFRAEDKSIDYACGFGTFEEAVEYLLMRYNLKPENIEIVKEAGNA